MADAYQMATQLDPGDYKAWHSWALVNFRMVEQVRTVFLSSPCLFGLFPIRPVRWAFVNSRMVRCRPLCFLWLLAFVIIFGNLLSYCMRPYLTLVDV